MSHAKLDMLIDHYLGDIERRGCTQDSVTPRPTLWTGDVTTTALQQ